MAKKTAFDIIRENNDIEVPYHVWTVFGDEAKTMTFAGDQVSIGCDYKNLTQMRAAIQWLAHQFGGHVNWSNPDSEEEQKSRKRKIGGIKA